jgi:hypothetical protein
MRADTPVPPAQLYDACQQCAKEEYVSCAVAGVTHTLLCIIRLGFAIWATSGQHM